MRRQTLTDTLMSCIREDKSETHLSVSDGDDVGGNVG